MIETLMIFGERIMFLGVQGLPIPANAGDNGGDGNSAAENGVTATQVQVPAGGYNGGVELAQQAGLMDMLPMLLVWGAVFTGMWFLMIRPQRKREKKMRELQATISTGDNIVTSGGMFGKVVDVGEDCFVVEFGTNRGIRIPVLKADVVAVRTPKMTPQAKETEQA